MGQPIDEFKAGWAVRKNDLVGMIPCWRCAFEKYILCLTPCQPLPIPFEPSLLLCRCEVSGPLPLYLSTTMLCHYSPETYGYWGFSNSSIFKGWELQDSQLFVHTQHSCWLLIIKKEKKTLLELHPPFPVNIQVSLGFVELIELLLCHLGHNLQFIKQIQTFPRPLSPIITPQLFQT